MTRRLAQALIAIASLGVGASASAQTTTTTIPSTSSTSPAKKELVQRLMRLQQSDVESFARSVVERPAAQMMREAGMALQQQQTPVPQDKREAAAKAIEVEVKKYVEEAYPIVRDRALKLAPSTIGSVFEAKMSEDELKQLIAWLESPTNKKYQSLAVELRNSFSQKLVAEMPPILDPNLMALDGRIRAILGVAPMGAPGAGAAAPPAARPASK